MFVRFFQPSQLAANDDVGTAKRERTVPIPESITTVPGYPVKLSVYKMEASKYWQVRCWIRGRTYRRSTKTENLRQAQSVARTLYEQWLAENYITAPHPQASDSAGDAVVLPPPKSPLIWVKP